MKKSKGFSLVEIIIVMVIIGILSLVAVPIYRGHVARSIATEGRALVHEAAASQEIFRARTQSWFTGVNNSTNAISELGLNSKRNNYFREFQFTIANANANSFTVSTTGKGKAENIIVTLTWTSDAPAVVTVKDKDGNEIN
ncbi:MAG: prepilin-type N-terminal cleavage/methylation domain-containing protein [Endomicrobium sp.]|jgi:prepilin-type N-terminal cleavage/methylation domain-containing protein|nr:prepilin-type N-terminal cleavage/methylation domain-containing protein [Endomicrobium sp.]